ncbi:hypothetical protein AX15_003542 [Amanita polypyramis BW_CC]|nr:hypothetical protein AX15_003542 [Amanita polypyramis BW_CC]
MSSKGLSLAEQIAQLEATPADFDPEDAEQEDLSKNDSSGIREHYVDVGPSTLQKYRDSIADPKYEGVRITRKSLMEESSEEDMTGDDEDEDDWGNGGESVVEPEESGGEDEEGSEAEWGGDEEGSEGEWEEDEEEEDMQERIDRQFASKKTFNQESNKEEEEAENMSTELKRKREDDKRKGKAVSRQIAIWDALLEARIRMQKAVNSANRLPRPSDIDAYIRQPSCREALNKMLDEALLLSDELYDLQEYLLTKNEGLSLPPRKRRRPDDREEVDYNKQLENASTDVVAVEHTMHPWLVQTLHKWSAKIQAVAPFVLLPSNRNAFSKGSQQVKSAVQLVEETLRSSDKLLARTRIRRGKERRIGVTAEEHSGVKDADGIEEDPELFDDTDFYQQLLRDVIDSKGNVGGADDWMIMQKEKRAKKKVDTKASKGRKIRYQVHEKIQNFMVPVPVIGAWHEEQTDELFASLLGKGFEAGVVHDDETMPQGGSGVMAELESQLDGTLKSGFKVFG